MSFAPITKMEGTNMAYRDISNWVDSYKEAFVQHHHDTSQLTLVLPDDCLVVAGPTRLYQTTPSDTATDAAVFFPIGFANTVTHTETRQVQPLKAIGSRRHIFAATNAPVQIQIARLLLCGTNTLRSLYGYATVGTDTYDRNTKFSHGGSGDFTSDWFGNLEEDLFRIPIGLGIIYNSPATLAGKQSKVAGADYFEVCTLQSKNVSIQSGQAMVMEQVTMYADRCVPWASYFGNATLTVGSPDYYQQVSQVSAME